MSPVDVRVVAIRSELLRDWELVRQQLERAESVAPGRGAPEAAFVALALDHAYEGFEQILLRLERALGLPERAGGAWHRALLADATFPIPQLRPEVAPTAAENDWEQLLGFRHFLRHAYAAELDPERLRRNVARLRSAVDATDVTLRHLLEALTTE